MENLTGKELYKALGYLGKRIPVIKLERVETFYPTVKNAQKTVVSNSDKEHWIYVFNYISIRRTLTVVLQPILMGLKVYSLKLSVLKISLSVLTEVL
jgi:hypothetical protein